MFRNKKQLECQPETGSPSPRDKASPLPCVSAKGKGEGEDKEEPPEMLMSKGATTWSMQEEEATKPLKTTGMKIFCQSSLRQARLWLKSCSASLMFPKPLQGDAKGQQRQKLREMGTYLQEVRGKAGLSLETVASITLIPLRLLRAIEAGDLDALPEPIYIRGFLKQFADALGLPGGEFARSFPTASEIKAAQKRRRVFYLPSLQLRPLHLYFLYLALVVLSVQGISYALKQQIQEMSGPPSPLLPSPLTVAPSQPAEKSAPPSPVAGTKTGKPLTVEVKLQAESWIEVIVDGKLAFNGNLPQGTHRRWQADKELTLRTKNAGSVSVALNGQPPRLLGNLGKVEEVTYQAN